MIKTICICGAGTMGSGIAQVAAQSGFDTILFDVNENALKGASSMINKNLSFLAEKGKITADDLGRAHSHLVFTDQYAGCVADIVIEAIIEDAKAKTALFEKVAAVNGEHTILASNTSSLSISDLQQSVHLPQRMAGMHFFNPAYLMKLVEVVRGKDTGDHTIDTLVGVCKQMNKTAVVCSDSPGFIVNRVARHYYLEAMKLVEEGVATFENVDAIMEATGFKMGPFRLMDLIGMDINFAVSQSIYNAFKKERFKPSAIQEEKVNKGELGRKTGKGFYDYT